MAATTCAFCGSPLGPESTACSSCGAAVNQPGEVLTDERRAAILAKTVDRYRRFGWKVGTQFGTRAELIGGKERRFIEVAPDGTVTDQLFDKSGKIVAPTSPSGGQPTNSGKVLLIGVLGIVGLIVVLA